MSGRLRQKGARVRSVAAGRHNQVTPRGAGAWQLVVQDCKMADSIQETNGWTTDYPIKQRTKRGGVLFLSPFLPWTGPWLDDVTKSIPPLDGCGWSRDGQGTTGGVGGFDGRLRERLLVQRGRRLGSRLTTEAWEGARREKKKRRRGRGRVVGDVMLAPCLH